MADAADSKSAGAQAPCRFDSDLGHHRGGLKAAAAILLAIIAIPVSVAADENPRNSRHPPEGLARHFIILTEHVLRPTEKADFASRGVEIQHVLPGNRYLVRAADEQEIAADPRVRSVEVFGPAKKIAPSALREAAAGRAFARLRLIFHDDVSFDDARAAIEGVGGTIDRPLAIGFPLPQRLTALIPATALDSLARDERVFGIYGPPLHAAADNSVAADLSHVTPLYAAPYGLTGRGVVLSEFELNAADTTHPEFQGRLTVDTTFTGGSSSDAAHATHVSGTMIAAGINPQAKGMAPAATLHEFNANSNSLMNDKRNLLPPLGIVADNNSWGFQLGWQFDGTAPGNEVWYDSLEYFGGYDGFYSAPYDKIAHNGPVFFVHSAGNDGTTGQTQLSPANWSAHGHVDLNGNLIKGETFCYSKDLTGTDCPTPFCSTPLSAHCEKVPHPSYGPYKTMGVLASTKNVIAVGAVNSSSVIASFSSRGPAQDGRVKPDVVAMGVLQYSTMPGGGYQDMSGTSMSSPVVTGIAAVLTEQWRRTFAGQNPTPQVLKTLLIAGADDVGNPGPDYTYGFGLVDAKKSVDLIIDDNGSGSRIRSGDISQGAQVQIPFTLSAAQNVRVVLGWSDPEVMLSPNDLAGKTLINDLDVKVIGPGGTTVLPYVLDPNNLEANATRGVNTTDNTEEVEIANAQPGSYHIVLTGTAIASGPTQHYVLVSNAALSGPAVVCTDIYEPNDTEATAYGPLASGGTIGARICPASDLDFYRVTPSAIGPLTVTATATDTPLRVTLSGNGITPVVASIAAGASGSVTTQVTSPPATYIVKVEPSGTVGATGNYTLTAVYSFAIPPRRRAVH